MVSYLKRFAPAASALLLGLSLTTGCGVDHSPVAPDEAAMTRTPDGRVLLTFAPQATQRAAKLAETSSDRTSSKLIGSAGDTLQVKDLNGRGTKDNLVVILKVPANALATDELITMTVHGETLSELVVEFAPAGLEFLTPAILKLRVGNKLVDTALEDILRIDHIHDDGTIERARVPFSAVKDNGRVRIKVEVPGFSRYSMGGRR